MSHLTVARPSFYSPIGICAECKNAGLHPDFPRQRVQCWDGAYDFQLCASCLGIPPSGQVDPSRFADLAEMHQRHDVATGIRGFRPYTVNPDGSYEGRAS